MLYYTTAVASTTQGIPNSVFFAKVKEKLFTLDILWRGKDSLV
jgi:hypothetical protein